MTKSEYVEKYGLEQYEEMRSKRREYQKKYYAQHKTEFAAYSKKWASKNKESCREGSRKYRLTHHDEILTYKKKAFHNHKATRAYSLYRAYKRADDLRRNGGCTITKDWILENVYSGQKCSYCGCSEWRELGLDRIDNSLPHTPDNVVVSCTKCNNKRRESNYFSFRYGVTSWNEIIQQLH